MVKFRARYIVLLLVVIIVVGIALAFFLTPSPSKPKEGTTALTAICKFEVKSVNLNNHTAVAKLDLELRGIQNVSIGGISRQPKMVYVQVSDSNNDDINCTLSNGIDRYEGVLDDASWYLYNFGEGYPYDLTFIQLKIMRLEFLIEGTRYGAVGFENYSYNINCQQSVFSGFNYDDLTYTWRINNAQNGEALNVQFIRNWLTPTVIIMFPLIWLLFLALFAPSLTTDRTTRITLYSSVLVFAPMFIFAIQTFIAPRGSPSIPEFMGIMLMLISTTFLLAALPHHLTSRELLLVDLVVFAVNFAFMACVGFAFLSD